MGLALLANTHVIDRCNISVQRLEPLHISLVHLFLTLQTLVNQVFAGHTSLLDSSMPAVVQEIPEILWLFSVGWDGMTCKLFCQGYSIKTFIRLFFPLFYSKFCLSSFEISDGILLPFKIFRKLISRSCILQSAIFFGLTSLILLLRFQFPSPLPPKFLSILPSITNKQRELYCMNCYFNNLNYISHWVLSHQHKNVICLNY